MDAARVAYLESGWCSGAIADTRPLAGGRCNEPYTLPDGRRALTEWSVGLWQVNRCVWPEETPGELLTVDGNAKRAAAIYAQQGWAAWLYSAQRLGLV